MTLPRIAIVGFAHSPNIVGTHGTTNGVEMLMPCFAKLYAELGISRRFTRLTHRHAGRWVIYLGTHQPGNTDSACGVRPPSPLGAAFHLTHLQLRNLHGHRPAASGRRKDAASPRPSPRKRVDPRRRSATARLAAQVATGLPWLAGEPLSRLTPALMRFATANTPWTGADVLAALADQALRRGHRLLDLDPHLI